MTLPKTVQASRPTTHRREFVITGVVQGVGFRPFVARLATDLGLAGTCANDTTSVQVTVEGSAAAVTAFGERLRTDAPPLAHLAAVSHRDVPALGDSEFRIVESDSDRGSDSESDRSQRTLVPPDVAVCDDCLTELRDPDNRRFRHPFITCTNCGPRLSIIRDLPYDRPRTTMASFPMCADCAQEYADPGDRRFHAQPVSCHACGPQLSVLTPAGAVVADSTESSITVVRAALRAGSLVAIKGIGGFHLSCDAANAGAVRELRRRKGRPDQPFAVMVADLAVAQQVVEVGDHARTLLTSPARPIVIASRRAESADWIAEDVAPGLPHLGVLLPYAPVHHLLLDGFPGLVMTSGNLSGEPLCIDNDEALARLAGIADLFLIHDREIHVPCEDSVISLDDRGDSLPVRRSRGYAPLPISLPTSLPGSGTGAGTGAVVLAAGAEIKNAPAMVRDGLAFLAAHVGDLGTLESRSAHTRTIDQLVGFHDVSPTLVVADSHPGYSSSAWARDFAAEHGVPLLEVQHHHAHLAALAAEHGRLDDPIVGAVFDGTGFGCDATIWGGEILVLGDRGGTAERVGRLAHIPLPGGDAAVRNPIRTAVAALTVHDIGIEEFPGLAEALDEGERAMLPGLARTSGSTSSAGRLFDVVSALLGVRHRISYEGQAAIELEAAATAWAGTDPEPNPPALSLPIVAGTDTAYEIVIRPLLLALAENIGAGADVGALAWAFHDGLARAGADALATVCADRGTGTVGLTGGVFQNRLLLSRTRGYLERSGLEVLTHHVVPPNDGGLALGQLAVGLAHERRR